MVCEVEGAALLRLYARVTIANLVYSANHREL